MTVDHPQPPTESAATPVCYRHPGRETYVRCTRCDRPICPDCMREAAVGFQCPTCVSEGSKGVRKPRTVYGGLAWAQSGQVSLVLIALNVGAFLAKLAAGSDTVDRRYANFSTVVLPSDPFQLHGLSQGEYYRMLTSVFLHVGVLHLALNMYLLWLLGPAIEGLVGRARFLALYLAAGLAGSAVSYVFNQGGEGASGAIFGLFAAYYIFTRHLGRDTSQITLLIVVNLIFSFVAPGVGYWAHLGGLAGGAVIGAAYAYAPRTAMRPYVQTGGVLAVLAAVVVITAARTAAIT